MFENVINKDDFLVEYGINLDLEVANDDDSANKAERYIHRVDESVKRALFMYEDVEFNEYNLPFYKKALMEQVNCCLKFGVDAPLCQSARRALRAGGFMNILRL